MCADGRIIQAASLQIDESGLTGESVPASKSAEVIAGDSKPGVGDQSNMAFMNSPVTHGSGVMIVTGTGADTEVGHISGMLKSTPTLKTPLSAQLDTLTLWIAGAAGLTIAIMFALGAARGDSTKAIFTTAIALALAAVPMAMPTVLQVILSNGSMTLAAEGAVVKSLASVETLGSTSAINSDKTGTLTLNQVTVVEVIDPTDRYAISGMGYGLEGDVKHAAGNTNTIEQAILPFLVCNDAKLVDGKVVGDPTEGALLVLGHKAKLDIEGTQAAYPRLATLPFDPTYKLMAVFADAKDASGNAVVRAFVKGAGPAVIGRASSALANGETVPWGDDAEGPRRRTRWSASAARGCASWSPATRDIDPSDFDPAGRPALADDRAADDGDGRDDRSAPGRVEGRRPQRPERQHPRPDGDRRRRHHRRGDRPAARHRGRGDPRRRLRGAFGGGAAVPHRRHRRRRPGGARAQGPDGRDPAQEGRRRRDDRGRRQRRARRSSRPTSASRWEPAPRSPRTPRR